jgi:glutathione S-transferase
LKERLAKLPDRARAWRQEQLLEKGLDASFVADAVRLHDKVLADMEKTLASSAWLAGDTFSLAECAIVPYILRLEKLGLARMWERRPRVADWYARVQARPSWAEAIAAFPVLGNGDYDDEMRTKGVDSWPKVKALLAA